MAAGLGKLVRKREWKPVDITHGSLSSGDLDGIVSLEVMSDSDTESGVVEPAEKKRRKNKKKKSQKKTIVFQESCSSLRGNDEDENKSEPQDKNPNQGTCSRKDPQSLNANIEDAKQIWSGFELESSLVESLANSGFLSPTMVQREAIPAILRDRRDIVCSAPTGSGKTLAFGIPIIDFILRNPDFISRGISALILVPTRELALQIQRHIKEATSRCISNPISIAAVVGGLSSQKQQRIIAGKPSIVVATPGRLWELMTTGGDSFVYLKTLREIKYLVLDEADRLLLGGHFDELKHILNYIRPLNSNEPSSDSPNGDDTESVPSFDAPVKEEIFKSPYLPKDNFCDSTEPQPSICSLRQTMIFSATLFLNKDSWTTKKSLMPEERALQELLKYTDMQKKPKFINLTSNSVIAPCIRELRSECLEETKDIYLYHFLYFNPGKTIVFCNSINSVRRLQSLLSLLKESPKDENFKYGLRNVALLHSGMQQRQRLSNLDFFRQHEHCVLLTTDIGARGIDIPSVDHVVHYHTPRDVATYVHRTGRTARAEKSGTSLILVSPKDMSCFKKIMQVLKKDSMEDVKLDMTVHARIKSRLLMATKLEKEKHSQSKVTKELSWFKKNSQEMDIILDDEVYDSCDSDHDYDSKKKKNVMEKLKHEMARVMAQPILATRP